jgi:putative DNA primase/helicase
VRHATPIEWLWPGRIARGKLTVIAGPPGSGKSTLAVRIAAAVSSGGAWPCGEGRAGQGLVVLICPEGDTDVLDPRLRAAGADLDRIRALRLDNEAVAGRPFDLGHHNLAVVAIAQMADADYLVRKPARLNALALASARTAFAIEVDPVDEDRRLLLQMKNELSPDPGTLAFRITPHKTGPGQSAGTIAFEQHRPGVSPHEFTERQSRSFNSAKAEAIAFLRDLFSNEMRVPVRDIESQASAFGLLKPNQSISQCRALRDARIALGLQAVRTGFAKDGAWSWAKPGAPAQERAEGEPTRPVAEMPQEPPAHQPPVTEPQPSAGQGSAPADAAGPSRGADPQTAGTVASPPLQPAATQTSGVAEQTG